MRSAEELRLAVVVPVLEEEAVLGRLLERLLGPGAERAGGAIDRLDRLDRADTVLVVDGGSRDRSRALAREAGARVLVTGRGRGRQMALGAREARGDVLLFLHADARPAPGALAELRRAFAGGARLACFRQRIGAPGAFYRLVERVAAARARRGRVYGDSGLALSRELYVRCGGLRPLPVFEDLDLSLRAAGHAPVELLDGPLEVDPRRWRREGPLRCTLRNRILELGFRLGVAPERLVRLYPYPAPSPPSG